MRLAQRSFTSGEISPSLYARTDISKYATGLKICRNSIVLRHGGVMNRPGTSLVSEARKPDKKIRLIPFVFNADQTYLLEFGHLYIRVHRFGAPVIDSVKPMSNISNGIPAVVTSANHGFITNDEVLISGVTGPMGDLLNNRTFLVGRTDANTFELLTKEGTLFSTLDVYGYISGGSASRYFTLASPYQEQHLKDLQYVQSADIVTIVHPEYEPRELSRTGHAAWALKTITFAPTISAPTNLTQNRDGGLLTQWVVTAVEKETYQESLPSAPVGSSFADTTLASTPNTIAWTPVTGAQEYNIYRSRNGVFGYIGTAITPSFIDTGISPDTSDTPPVSRNPFVGAGNYPAAVAFIQQRRAFGNTNNNPQKVWMSRIAQFENFTTSAPLQDDDAVTFSLVGRQVNSIRHLLDLGKFVVLTSAGEWLLGGDSGVVKPGEIGPKQTSYNGVSILPPIIIGGTALYVQARGTVVRDLDFDIQTEGYRGNDLSIFATHLFKHNTIVDWNFQQIPNSVVWAVRDDGLLLGLTYVREHQVLGWHRHDFDGTVENVCCLPEGTKDAVYLCIKRTINGKETRYIERFTEREPVDETDLVILDCAMSYDGRNTDPSQTMQINDGVTWNYTEMQTLNASFSAFLESDVGNEIQLTGPDGSIIRFMIEFYIGGTQVRGKPHKRIPESMRNVALSTWTKAVDEIGGLWHIEGKQVSVFADRFVVASVHNPSYNQITVHNGKITLDQPYGVVHVGLPITSDIQLLDIDTPSGEPLYGKKKYVGKINLFLESTRGLFGGIDIPQGEDLTQGLYELKQREIDLYDQPIPNILGSADIVIEPQWNNSGSVFLRQVDPLPFTLLSVSPEGYYPIGQTQPQGG